VEANFLINKSICVDVD